jgi:hypothetical protein
MVASGSSSAVAFDWPLTKSTGIAGGGNGGNGGNGATPGPAPPPPMLGTGSTYTDPVQPASTEIQATANTATW